MPYLNFGSAKLYQYKRTLKTPGHQDCDIAKRYQYENRQQTISYSDLYQTRLLMFEYFHGFIKDYTVLGVTLGIWKSITYFILDGANTERHKVVSLGY